MAQHPDLTEAIELALQFAQFVRQRQPTNSTSGLNRRKEPASFQLLLSNVCAKTTMLSKAG